jgi:hypothetical protein
MALSIVSILYLYTTGAAALLFQLIISKQYFLPFYIHCAQVSSFMSRCALLSLLPSVLPICPSELAVAWCTPQPSVLSASGLSINASRLSIRASCRVVHSSALCPQCFPFVHLSVLPLCALLSPQPSMLPVCPSELPVALCNPQSSALSASRLSICPCCRVVHPCLPFCPVIFVFP